jgi:hypothetical protein
MIPEAGNPKEFKHCLLNTVVTDMCVWGHFVVALKNRDIRSFWECPICGTHHWRMAAPMRRHQLYDDDIPRAPLLSGRLRD